MCPTKKMHISKQFQTSLLPRIASVGLDWYHKTNWKITWPASLFPCKRQIQKRSKKNANASFSMHDYSRFSSKFQSRARTTVAKLRQFESVCKYFNYYSARHFCEWKEWSVKKLLFFATLLQVLLRACRRYSVQIKNKIQAKQSVSVVTCKKVYKK